MVLIHFEPPTRGQPLHKGHNSWIYIVPKVSFIRRFHCTIQSMIQNHWACIILREHPTHSYRYLVSLLEPFPLHFYISNVFSTCSWLFSLHSLSIICIQSMISSMMHDLIYRLGHLPLWRLSLEQVITTVCHFILFIAVILSFRVVYCILSSRLYRFLSLGPIIIILW